MIKALSLMAVAAVAMGLSVSLAQADDHEPAFQAHVATNNIAPVTLTHMAVGDVIPEATELHPVPDAIIATAPNLPPMDFTWTMITSTSFTPRRAPSWLSSTAIKPKARPQRRAFPFRGTEPTL